MEFKINEEQESIRFIGLDEKKILNQKSNEQIQEECSRTVQIINIPLYITPKDIRAIFSRYGEIEEKGFYTRVKGIYQQAYITYKEEDALTIFSKHWSVWTFKEYLQVISLDLSEEKRLERKEYSIKLCGLPSNTTARDIQSFIEEVNAATFFIPKKLKGYQPLKYAYINFYSQKDLETATRKVVLESKSMKEELVKLKAEQIQKDNNQKESRNNKKGVHFNISSSSKLNDNNKRLKTDSSDSEKEKEENINIFENKLKQQDKYLNNIAESLLNIQSQLEKIEHNKKDDVSVGGSYNIHDNDDELIDIN
ncbi:hypothetical protein GLOIN_2v1811259 [Rhizophagus clarus]|uniref:RRM domain-containing protein n=1 Tax=Rhizophagus clarus TaxID=94130 RepID=A0A8H3MEQ3_9GLOM|nr:hypothetical protein GLOIN_2v1811259 [Rhizophagus clarus]